MTRVGLVLGAGGVVGQAYHAGVLAVLEHDYGFDARDVDMIVGTSAGSITGTLLRLGVSSGDLAAWTVKAPLSGDDEFMRRMAEMPDPRARAAAPAGPDPAADAPAQPAHGAPRDDAALAVPAAGGRPGAARAWEARHRRGSWPRCESWRSPGGRTGTCGSARSAGATDGGSSSAGRDPLRRPIHLAMAASCAVPGYFAPVRIGDHSYVDGGVHSPTNAAILRGQELDLVIVISPMSGPPGPSLSLLARLPAPFGAAAATGRCGRWSARESRSWSSHPATPSRRSWATT